MFATLSLHRDGLMCVGNRRFVMDVILYNVKPARYEGAGRT